MHGMPIRIGVDGDSLDPEAAGCANDTAGDFASAMGRLDQLRSSLRAAMQSGEDLPSDRFQLILQGPSSRLTGSQPRFCQREASSDLAELLLRPRRRASKRDGAGSAGEEKRPSGGADALHAVPFRWVNHVRTSESK